MSLLQQRLCTSENSTIYNVSEVDEYYSCHQLICLLRRRRIEVLLYLTVRWQWRLLKFRVVGRPIRSLILIWVRGLVWPWSLGRVCGLEWVLGWVSKLRVEAGVGNQTSLYLTHTQAQMRNGMEATKTSAPKPITKRRRITLSVNTSSPSLSRAESRNDSS